MRPILLLLLLFVASPLEAAHVYIRTADIFMIEPTSAEDYSTCVCMGLRKSVIRVYCKEKPEAIAKILNDSPTPKFIRLTTKD